GATEHGGKRFDRRAGDVELWLLRGQRDAGGLRVEAQLPRSLLLRAVALAHPASPDPARGAKLGDLLEKVDVGVEEEGKPGREIIDVHAAFEARIDIGHAVRECERELLDRGRPGLSDVIAGD